MIDASENRHIQVNQQINAVVTTCHDRARGKAGDLSALDTDHPAYLAGLSIGIKDLSTVSGVCMTKGTMGMKDFVPDASDPIVDILENRGGLVVGKTNTPEMGAGGNTFNDVFGMTRNL